MHINREKFFNQYKKEFGSIKTKEIVNNINTMLDSLEKFAHLFASEVFVEQLAYVAATVHHETGMRYSAFKELRQVKTDNPARLRVRRLQDRYWLTGYYGRGPVQLTWDYNYSWAEKATGAPLLKDPDLLLRNLALGYEVAVKGMVTGAFTGKSLNSYIAKDNIDFISARKVVNGRDRAVDIARYADKYVRIFQESIES